MRPPASFSVFRPGPSSARLSVATALQAALPVALTVPVEIPMSETELHEPFVGLQEVVSPFYWMLIDLPNSWAEAKCIYMGWGCP